MQRSATLAALRDAVLDGVIAGDAHDGSLICATSSPVPQDIGQIREEMPRLSTYLESLDRQYFLQTSMEAVVKSLKKLPSTSGADNGSTIDVPTQFTNDLVSEIMRIQKQLIASQSTLLSHYTSLLEFTAESYVFPVSSILESSDSLCSVHGQPMELQFDVDSLLIADTSGLTADADSFTGAIQNQFNKLFPEALWRHETEDRLTSLSREPTVTLEEHNQIVSSITYALEVSKKDGEKLHQDVESERNEKESLLQAVGELEASVLDISAKQRGQQDEIRFELENVQSQLLQTQSELQYQLDLHTQNDEKHAQELEKLQRQVAPSPQIPESTSAADVEKLQAENIKLQERVAQFQTDMAVQAEQHAAEFETILMQNASLNERLAEMDTKKSNRNSVQSSSLKSVLPSTTVSNEHLADSGVNGTEDPQRKITILQNELRGLVSSYENLMGRSLEYENERVHLEREIASLRDKNERLEAKILDNRVKVLASHTNGSSNTENINPNGTVSQSESATIGVLRKEFRKLVAEMKSDHAAAMKAEFEERRRLEKVIRDMKRTAT
ncbi:hypothetical protein V1506DRAFT_529563 [Lipomyces tetrasporus]